MNQKKETRPAPNAVPKAMPEKGKRIQKNSMPKYENPPRPPKKK